MNRTTEELGYLFIFSVCAAVQFINEERPPLAKRALHKAKKYSDLQLFQRCEENKLPAPSPKIAKEIFKRTLYQTVHAIIAQ
ncbi:MAG: hypothetical protein ACE3JK_14090 [Sporolactobacillus sp.]